MDIVVNDASILIDLIDINLIYKFFDLGFIFYTTGYVISELSDYEIIGELVHANRLRVQNPDAEEQLQIGQLNADYNNLSIHDCSCLWLSKKKSAIMLTGDKALTRAGKKIGMEVHGSLWILDELVKNQIVTVKSAYEKLALLKQINPRIPIKESDDLLSKWSKLK